MASNGRSERQRHRVPGVGVLRAAVEQHDLGFARTPTQRTQRRGPVATSTSTRATVGGPE